MIKSKKQMFVVIGVFTLVLLLGSVTYAFFNYTRTGSPNNFSVGRIYFKSDNEETITLNNLFPIDPSNATEMNDPTKVGTYSIDITGDTDYVDGLEYLVSVVDSDISNLPISIDVSVSNGLGTSSDNYFTARESKNASIYKKLMGDTITGDGMLLVGYVKPNTTSGVIEGVDGTITITAYLDKNKILISDTYDGTESDNMGTTNAMAEGKTVISTDDWNSLSANGASFKVKVEANEGIWVNRPLEEIMKKSAVMDNVQSTYVSASTGINFGASSSNTNGKGIYMRAGTENDENPIAYYRGDINDNNVLFNNMCWKAVRTTDTGGVKLLYSGMPNIVHEKVYLEETSYSIITENTDSNWVFDSNDNTWNIAVTDDSHPAIEFTVPAGDNYTLMLSGTNNISCGGMYRFYINGSNVRSYYNNSYDPISLIYDFGTLSQSDVIRMDYTENTNTNCSITFKLKMQTFGEVITDKACNNENSDTFLNLGVDQFNQPKYTESFNSNNISPSSVGYMYGDIYNYNTTVRNSIYGNSFTWDGASYKLVNTASAPDATHHYTCEKSNANDTCTNILYVYYTKKVNSTVTKYYITLSNGDSIEDAMANMQTNTNNSNVKTIIDTWYANNMTNHTAKLEDTIWCNDRSMGDGNNNGWIPNGGELSRPLLYGSHQRGANAVNSSIPNQPSLECPNINDSFTVSTKNGNGKLTYPVALLTSDEFVLAGATSNTYSSDKLSYVFCSNCNYWTLSPDTYTYSVGSNVYSVSGNRLDSSVSTNTGGIRPAISIKPGQPIKSGTGTALDPYVIE